MNTWAILLAAGRSSRLAGQGVATPKQFLPFQGAPLFWHSAKTFSRLAALRGIVFVFPAHATDGAELCEGNSAVSDDTQTGPGYESLLASLEAGQPLGLPWRLAFGGPRRQDSVSNGLAALPRDCDAVLIHDSARPFASASLMQRVLTALRDGSEAVIPGIPVTDTIKSVDEAGEVLMTHPREYLRAVQTPQGFRLGPLREAHARAEAEGWQVTDDASLLERCGTPVLVVPGEEANRKLTTFDDLRLITDMPDGGSLDRSFLEPCSGFGYDVHKYGGTRPFILGGVPIACGQTVAAHSDGDALLHALIDALLGCIGGGDIGDMFPDTDPALDNISSGILLSEVLERCRVSSLVVNNVDITVIAQVPRIAPHKEAIAANVAKLLQVPRGSVNVKATTEEGLGFTGEKKGIKVVALVTGQRPGQQA